MKHNYIIFSILLVSAIKIFGRFAESLGPDVRRIVLDPADPSVLACKDKPEGADCSYRNPEATSPVNGKCRPPVGISAHSMYCRS